MTIHTILLIDPDTLKPENDRFFMRSGSLTALKKLSDHGFFPAGNFTRSAPEVLQLLTQEQIEFRVLTEEEKPSDISPDAGAGKNTSKASGTVTGAGSFQTVRITAGPSDKLALQRETSGSESTKGTSGSSGTKSPSGSSGSVAGKRSAEAAASGEPADSLLFPGWNEIAGYLLTEYRSARHSRKTGETDISVSINLDGTGESHIETGIPFYDHMLEQIARHGYMDLEITCRGDLHIDEHHTIEDTAIALGEAIGMALGDKRGIGRYGFVVAMDETRSLVAIDLSGRPWCVFEGTFKREKVGDFPTEMTSHFFHSLAMALKATLHVSVKGGNDHHQIEACFKALARCLRQAADRNEKYRDILPSSKGLL